MHARLSVQVVSLFLWMSSLPLTSHPNVQLLHCICTVYVVLPGFGFCSGRSFESSAVCFLSNWVHENRYDCYALHGIVRTPAGCTAAIAIGAQKQCSCKSLAQIFHSAGRVKCKTARFWQLALLVLPASCLDGCDSSTQLLCTAPLAETFGG